MAKKARLKKDHTAARVLSGQGPWTSWESIYRGVRPEELPWNAGAPDSHLVRLVKSKIMKPGRALDIGTGPGHDAIYLAQRGFRVLAVDIAPAAVKLARANAKKAELAAAIKFRAGDILKLRLPPASFGFVNDRGCFHVLDSDGRKTYLRRVAGALAPRGLLLLKTFSDQEPPGPGPRRFSKQELRDFFLPLFELLQLKSGIFAGPRKPKAYVCLLRKREHNV